MVETFDLIIHNGTYPNTPSGMPRSNPGSSDAEPRP